MNLTRSVASISFALLVAACSTGPSVLPAHRAVEGAYALREIDGAELPRRFQTSGVEYLALLADTLIFFRTGRVLRVTVMESREPASGALVPTRHEQWMEYRRRGDDLSVGSFTCRDTLACLAPDEGTFMADRIELATWRFPSEDGGSRPRLVYHKR